MTPTVLLVDDNEDVVELIGLLLTALGYEVITARDGIEGLAMVVEHAPDIVFSDINMPLMDGYELARRARRYGYPGVMVAATAYGSRSDVERSLEAGFSAHLVKPVTIEKVVHLVKESTKPSKPANVPMAGIAEVRAERRSRAS